MPLSADTCPAELVLWRQLMAAGFRAGVRYEDAQDLASQTILRALEAHDPSRGPFGPFCRTVHASLLKNHWRDRKQTVEFDPESDGAVDPIDPLGRLESLEEREMFRGVAEKILAQLEPEEAAFFLALAGQYREAENAAVSATARTLGIDPLKGWDVFRRIQRKARPFLAEFRFLEGLLAESEEPARLDRAPDSAPEPDEPGTFDRAVSSLPEPEVHASIHPSLIFPRDPAPDSTLLIVSLCATAGHERFAAALTAEQRSRLAAKFA